MPVRLQRAGRELTIHATFLNEKVKKTLRDDVQGNHVRAPQCRVQPVAEAQKLHKG